MRCFLIYELVDCIENRDAFLHVGASFSGNGRNIDHRINSHETLRAVFIVRAYIFKVVLNQALLGPKVPSG